MKRFKLGFALMLVALASLGPAVGPSAAGPADGPSAHASKRCKSVNTHNGRRATFITVSGALGCRRARKVAARANGRRYMALGFDCKKSGKPSASGQLYGCGGTVNGKASGIGFFYKKR